MDLGTAARLFTAATVAAVLLAWPPSPAVNAAPVAAGAPNIVYIVVDDLSSNLVPYMSEVGRLADEGVAFDRFFVTDSQCCPSRASTLTGMYPHNSEVLTNGGKLGGFHQFLKHHPDDSLGPQMSAAGYRTGYIGKYLNGYRPNGSRGTQSRPSAYPAGFVPTGWDEWHVSGDAYAQFDYTVAEAVDTKRAEIVRYGHDESDYHTDVMTRTATDFLDRAVGQDGTANQPFFLTLAPFAVHSRIGPGRIGDQSAFPPAPRDRALVPGAKWPAGWTPPVAGSGDCGDIAGGCDAVPFPDPADAGAFNQVPKAAPDWMGRGTLGPANLAKMRAMYLDRIRMAQSVNDLIREVRAHLEALDLDQSTYVVFTSDNGFHLGEHGLPRGKNSMFDHDIRVPTIVVPPGGTQPRTVGAVTQNTDLLPTFLDLAGSKATGSDGRSLVPFLEGNAKPHRWRQSALVEFTHGRGKHDPDLESGQDTPTYRGVRTPDYVYVDYTEASDSPGVHEAEFYDLARDPDGTVNRFRELSRAQRKSLDQALDTYASCVGHACLAAGRSMPEVTTSRN